MTEQRAIQLALLAAAAFIALVYGLHHAGVLPA